MEPPPAIEVDRERCQGTGYCERLLEDVFRVGADGVATVVRGVATEAELAGAREAAELCPTRAIRLRYAMKPR
jgi:ferredoxin